MRSERCTLAGNGPSGECGVTAARNAGGSCVSTAHSLPRGHGALAVPNHAGAQSPSTPAPEVLRVTRTADDGGEGSLRWAIERNNAAPGRLRIEVDPAGAAPYVIKLASPLPTIKGPVAIEGAPWKRSGEFVALDGSGYIEDKGPQTCPGASPANTAPTCARPPIPASRWSTPKASRSADWKFAISASAC